ncbi:hypothetical protein EMN47_10825 [Prolixibacteraceae bacterium JC049]|nr:hypothetical protein [Prolixibacteraceae bacterium JC049]
MTNSIEQKRRARESRGAIEKLYITMRHLFIRGNYKPFGVSGQGLMKTLLTLNPEIYGTMSDPGRVEIDGLLYVLDRLPRGIERCRHIRLIAREGFEESGYEVVVPLKRRRSCYRIDNESMYIEVTRGRSDIYDILTHLTFLFNEAQKIMQNGLDPKGNIGSDWKKLEKLIHAEDEADLRVGITYLSNILGRTFAETKDAVERFSQRKGEPSLFEIIYWMGQLTMNEYQDQEYREITFSAKLREIIGHHVYGEMWAHRIKEFIDVKNWGHRPLHIVSANLHSFMNALYGYQAGIKEPNLEQLALQTSKPENKELRDQIKEFALAHGMHEVKDISGTNIGVQFFELDKLEKIGKAPWLDFNEETLAEKPLIMVMDYAFGEQAYECMDELFKPLKKGDERFPLNVESVSVMGKAGILKGGKGDIMIPTAHVFEGTGDNYPFQNEFKCKDFENQNIGVYKGAMITVLGTSLQNRDVLIHFVNTSWDAVGLEMEGAHYQKAIQASALIRRNINPQVKVRYAYYASDNPLETGATLASGSLGNDGVKPTYLITQRILEQILA